MQQVEIEIVSSETTKACVASARHQLPRNFVVLDFGNQEYAVSLTGNHVADRHRCPW